MKCQETEAEADLGPRRRDQPCAEPDLTRADAAAVLAVTAAADRINIGRAQPMADTTRLHNVIIISSYLSSLYIQQLTLACQPC